MKIRPEHFPQRYSHGIVGDLAFLSGALLLGGIAWQVIAVGVSAVRGVDFPTPVATLRHLVLLLAGEQLIDQNIYHHIGDSLKRWITGFLLAATCGILYGLVAGRDGVFRRITLPLVHCLQLIPGLAWIPIALLLFGISERTTVFIAGEYNTGAGMIILLCKTGLGSRVREIHSSAKRRNT
jgi:ABC-type nitrate/sulfonate/bicarbonate transport system permease component